jgi:hypothetical protein
MGTAVSCATGASSAYGIFAASNLSSTLAITNAWCSCLYDLDSGLGEPILESILAGGEHALSTEEGQHLVPIMRAVHRVRHLAIVR